MQTKTKTSILLIGICLIATRGFGQGKQGLPNGYPNNPYDSTLKVTPAETVQYYQCEMLNFTNQPPVPLEGVNINLTTYTTIGSGWHAHDGGNSGRPQAEILSTQVQATDATGCAYWQIKLPGYAGWYTFEGDANSAVYGGTMIPVTKTGKNVYAQYSIADSNGYQVYLEAYPANSNINYIAIEPQDPGHQQYINYLLPDVVTQVTNASSLYAINAPNEIGYGDRIAITRGSLPSGGTADNDSPFAADNWDTSTRYWEEHAIGEEVDIENPSLVFPTSAPEAVYLAFQAFANYQCFPGDHQPSFSDIVASYPLPKNGVFQFWIGQSIIHIVCSDAPIHRVIH